MSTLTPMSVIPFPPREVWYMSSVGQYKTLAALLKNRRLDLKGTEREVTQPEIALAIKQSQAQVWKIENGQADITKWFPERQLALLRAYRFTDAEIQEIVDTFRLEIPYFAGIRGGLHKYPPDPGVIGETNMELTDWHVFYTIGSASAGTGDGEQSEDSFAVIPVAKYISRGASPSEIMAVTVDGDCLVSQSLRTSRRSIAHGDTVFVHVGAPAQANDIVCVWDDEDGQLMLKFVSEQQDPDHPNEITFYDAKGQTYIRDVADVKYRGVVFYRTSDL